MTAGEIRTLRLELACFAALAAFAALNWVAVVADPPLGRTLAVVALATAVGAALARLGRADLRRPALLAASTAAALGAVVLALIVVGLPARLLLPAGWGELAEEMGASLPSVADVSVPYDGRDGWLRLSILLGAPVLVGLAAAAAFWPARRRAAGRLAALALLVGLYLTAVTWRGAEGELERGIALLILIAAWLWLPGLSATGAVRAALAVVAAGLVAVPLAATLGPDRPLWDYRSWRLFGSAGIAFGWEHDYGPLDWPQRGTAVFEVRSDLPRYWRATSLDSFDGERWRRSEQLGPEPILGDAATLRLPIIALRSEWVERFRFEVRGLSSEVIVGPGTILSVKEVRGAPAADGTWRAAEEISPGDSYSVLSYVPNPTATMMRAAPARYPREAARYTALSLPTRAGGEAPIRAPFWSKRRSSEVAAAVRGTPYAPVLRLARDLVAGAPTPYDAVDRVESHLRAGYEYDQNPPDHEHPLPAFLFGDRRGYCQQFSGAMALMLRMVGIPARVSTGFAPGSDVRSSGDGFLVEDLDAHSWVEAYFWGLGWVPFDPTPPAAPAGSQLHEAGATGDGDAAVSLGADPAAGTLELGGGGAQEVGRGGSGAVATRAGGGGGAGALAVVAGGGAAALLLLAAGGTYLLRARRRRRLGPDALARAELDELRRAAKRLGWPLAGTTLLELERRLQRTAGAEAGRYAARLRERRYRNVAIAPPTAHDRRALRRSLARAGGWRSVLAAVAAIPPGGPGGIATTRF